LLQKGELEEWLLDVLWSELEGVELSESIKNNLVTLLETFDIATPIEHEGRRRLLIPEFQPRSLKLETWRKDRKEEEFVAQRWICVNCNLPCGLLKRIQVRVIKKIFKRSGTNAFDFAQNEFYIKDTKCAEVYCTKERGGVDCPGSGIPEGIMLYVRGSDKQHVMTVLAKVYRCLEDTLKDFPGLIFDHYAVYTSSHNKGVSFIKLEVLKEKQKSDVKTINVALKQSTTEGAGIAAAFTKEVVEVDDLIPPRKSL